jgi:hypothetical protein
MVIGINFVTTHRLLRILTLHQSDLSLMTERNWSPNKTFSKDCKLDKTDIHMLQGHSELKHVFFEQPISLAEENVMY